MYLGGLDWVNPGNGGNQHDFCSHSLGGGGGGGGGERG